MASGRRFWKMSGSGNDFVFVDGRTELSTEYQDPETIARICARGTGVGADGLVILTRPRSADANVALTYYNADGSLAELCGNATLCTASLAVRLGVVDPSGFAIETGTGVLRARIRNGRPEFDLALIDEAEPDFEAIAPMPGELHVGFATAGIPHVVIQVVDVGGCDVVGRGRSVRHHRALPNGANANFVARGADGIWRIRTYERGVEAETLACGTGSVATALMLNLWGEATGDVELETASGGTLGVRSHRDAKGIWHASLRGEGRLVYEGVLADV